MDLNLFIQMIILLITLEIIRNIKKVTAYSAQ